MTYSEASLIAMFIFRMHQRIQSDRLTRADGEKIAERFFMRMHSRCE